MGKINIIEYDASGNVVATATNVDDPFSSFVDHNIYNEDGTIKDNRTVTLNGNSLIFAGDQNSVVINGNGSIGINDNTISLTDIIKDYDFNGAVNWTLNNTYPGTNSSSISSGILTLTADSSAGYNEWRIISQDVYPAESTTLIIDWEIVIKNISASGQVIELALADKSNVFKVLEGNAQSNTTYSGTVEFINQSPSAASPIFRVYVSSPQTGTIEIESFRLQLRQSAIQTRNLETNNLIVDNVISVSPTTNPLSTTVSEFGRMFVSTTNNDIYYRPPQSTADYSLTSGGSHGANCVEFQYDGTSSGAPANGKFKSPGTSSLASIAQMNIDNENIYNIDITPWLSIIDSSLNTYARPGYLQISEKGSPEVTALYSFFSYFDSTTYKSLGLNYICGSGTLTVGKNYLISYVFDGLDPATAGFVTAKNAIALSIALG